MKKYQILEHRADLKIKIFGKKIEDLFSNGLFVLFKKMKPIVKKRKIKRKIKVKAENLESLLFNFLNEVIYFSQVFKESYEKIVFKKCSFEKKFFIEAVLLGNKIEKIGMDIKALTYHQLKIEKEKGMWSATLLFDI